ncbi:MAG: hypothetical protein ACT4P6_03220 [Gemmatimonadaceae bacterium]
MRYIVLCGTLAGCYAYVPITPGEAPPAGEPVALEISDAGRVGLSERFGPGLTRVEGRLTTSAAQEYALNVHRVAFIGAPATRWSGELVRIDRGFVGRIQQRKLAKGRTALTVGAVTLAIAAVFIATDLVGFFDGSGGGPPEPPGPISNRVGH